MEFGKKRSVIGFDINAARIQELSEGRDHTLECSPEKLREARRLIFSSDAEVFKTVAMFIVTVPTPVDRANRPDMTSLVKASETVGRARTRSDIVIYESTVYLGAMEEVCVPVLEKASGLTFNQDTILRLQPGADQPG